MKIDGRRIAEEIRSQLKLTILKLKTKGIIPKIAIITLGPETFWETYVRQKIKVADKLGIEAVLISLEDADEEKLIRTVREIDKDPKYHGIIVQRPMPNSISREKVINAISPEKDVDGFRPNSKFEVPVWLAVKRLLEESFEIRNLKFEIGNLSLVVIGKGETAGSPIIRGLKKMGVEPQVIDTKTVNPDEILKNADIVISCVGKQNIVRTKQIKKGAILIGVGIHGEDLPAGPLRREASRQAQVLRGDYDEKEIEQIAGAYTPTPGGVGPINLSYLFKNLIEATKNQNL